MSLYVRLSTRSSLRLLNPLRGKNQPAHCVVFSPNTAPARPRKRSIRTERTCLPIFRVPISDDSCHSPARESVCLETGSKPGRTLCVELLQVQCFQHLQ